MKCPLVSIIIVNWNGKELLSVCLNSLFKITYPNFEIIVVDNGSTDGSVEFIKKLIEDYSCKFVSGTKKPSRKKKSRVPPIRDNSCDQTIKLIENRTNLGFAEGNNIGVRETKGEYFLLLNNDTEVEPDFLEPLVKEMESNSKKAVVQPRIIFSTYQKLQAGGSFFTSSGFLYPFGFFKDFNALEFNRRMEIFSANGACMLIRKAVIDKIGLFDPDFFSYFEETDFCWRVILAGFKVIYEPKSVIFHKGRQTSIRLASGISQYLSFRNRICGLVKNLSFIELLKVLPLHVIFSVIWFFAFLVFGKVKCALAIPKAYWWNAINLKSTLGKRKVVQRDIRKISDMELMAKFKKERPLEDYPIFFYKTREYKG